MKNLKYLVLLLPILLVVGCAKSDVTSPDANFDSPKYMMVDYFETENAIEDATIDTDLTLNTTFVSYSFMTATDFTPGKGMLRGMMHNWLTKYDWNKHLGMIFKRLKLTDKQKTDVEALVKAYHEAMKPLVQKFAEGNKDIIEKAKTDRQAIAKDLKDGKITREAATTKIKELNAATKKAIAENPLTVEVKKEMCAKRAALLTDVRKVLDSEQQKKWDEAVAKMKSPC